MAEMSRRERRSPMVMLLDMAMRLAIAAQSGPRPHVRPAGRTSRSAVGWLLAGVLLAVAGTAVVVGALLNGPDELSSLPPHAPVRAPAADPVPSPVRSPSADVAPAANETTTATRPPGRASSRPGPAPSPAEPPAAALTARYEAADGGSGLLGYAATVTVTNPGSAGRNGWRVALTLPRPTLRIAAVSGASAKQDGATWTFEPDATTRSVPAGGSVLFSFEVQGATLLAAAPRDCRIDGRPCAGIGGSAPPSR